MSANEVRFPLRGGDVVVWTTPEGLWIDAGITVAIPRDAMLSYVESFDLSPAEGFFTHAGRVILSHGCSKMSLSVGEAAAIVDLAKRSFL